MRVTLNRCWWSLLLLGVVAPVQATDTRFDAVDASVDARASRVGEQVDVGGADRAPGRSGPDGLG